MKAITFLDEEVSAIRWNYLPVVLLEWSIHMTLFTTVAEKGQQHAAACSKTWSTHSA